VETPLPFVAYLGGAAAAVAVSFVLVAMSDAGPVRAWTPDRVRIVPRVVRLLLRTLGLIAWLWVAAQALIGGTSDGDVASLFLWTYGWIGLAILSAFLGPVWSWIDPFTTLHDIGAWVLRRVGIRGIAPAPWPDRLGWWPAVAGFAFFVWLELVPRIAEGPALGVVMLGYTAVTLVGMAQYGRDPWRERGETFSVWFALLGRLAAFAPVGPPGSGRIARRPFGAGLTGEAWPLALVVLVTIGTGSIIYDGLSQTKLFFDLFGLADNVSGTLILGAFLLLLVTLVLAVGRRVGRAAMGAGLLPVAVGYLIAHYLSALLVDGQRILISISDPFNQGWDLFGTAFSEPTSDWLAVGAVWTIQVGSVVIGHIVGAWAGHGVARPVAGQRAGRAWELPLAMLMVGLTTVTLWSLGQNLVFETGAMSTGSAAPAATAPR
jgi:hypothetical protein